MARLAGIEPSNANLFTRLVYWMTKRQIGRVVQPLKMTAHSGPLLWGVGQMEYAQTKMHTVDERLKALAEIKVAAMVGCPF
jgi:hypothetical protein